MEWPLIFYTVLSQMAAGSFIAFFFLDKFYPSTIANKKLFLSIAILVLTGISMLAATTHLGKPFFAYRAIYHFKTSWLSREIIIFTIFMGINFIYSLSLYKKISFVEKLSLPIGACIAFIAVIITSMIYVLPSHPAWNNLSTPLAFIMTELILGAFYLSILMTACGLKVPSNVFNFIFIAIFCNLFFFLIHLSLLADGRPSMVDTYNLIIASPLLYLRLVSEVIIPLLFYFWHLSKHRPLISAKAIYLLFILVLSGEFLGRMIFYSTSVPIILF